MPRRRGSVCGSPIRPRCCWSNPLGKGRVLLLTTGFDRLTSDLPLHPEFVAFVDRLATYLSGRGSRVNA